MSIKIKNRFARLENMNRKYFVVQTDQKELYHHQLNKLKEFFDLVRENFVIESFSDIHYRMLVTIPDVYVYKSEQNTWNVEIWIAEELFDYFILF